MLPSFAAMAPNHVYTTWQLPRGLCIVFGQNVDSRALHGGSRVQTLRARMCMFVSAEAAIVLAHDADGGSSA